MYFNFSKRTNNVGQPKIESWTKNMGCSSHLFSFSPSQKGGGVKNWHLHFFRWKLVHWFSHLVLIPSINLRSIHNVNLSLVYKHPPHSYGSAKSSMIMIPISSTSRTKGLISCFTREIHLLGIRLKQKGPQILKQIRWARFVSSLKHFSWVWMVGTLPSGLQSSWSLFLLFQNHCIWIMPRWWWSGKLLTNKWIGD